MMTHDLTLPNILKRVAYDAYEQALADYSPPNCPDETEAEQYSDGLKQYYERELAIKQRLYDSPLLSVRRLFHNGQDLLDEIELIKSIITILNTNSNE